MEKLLIDPKPKYLPLYPSLPPTKYPEIIPSDTSAPSIPSTPIPVVPITESSSLPIPKKSFSFSYSIIIGIVVLLCFVFFAIYYNYKSDKNRKNNIVPIYAKNYKVSLDEMKEDAKKFIKNTVNTVSSYKDYIQNLGGKYFSSTYIEKGTLRTSAPTIPPKPTPKKKSVGKTATAAATVAATVAATATASSSPSVKPVNTIKSTPANTTEPTTIIQESKKTK